MATRLTKDITRETLHVTDMKNNVMMVTLQAGDMLVFRAKGKRIRYEIPLQTVLFMAVANYLESQYQKKVSEYKRGLRKRRPRRPPFFFRKQIYECLSMSKPQRK